MNLRNVTDWCYSETVQRDTWKELKCALYSDNLDRQLKYSIQDTEVATRGLNQYQAGKLIVLFLIEIVKYEIPS